MEPSGKLITFIQMYIYGFYIFFSYPRHSILTEFNWLFCCCFFFVFFEIMQKAKYGAAVNIFITLKFIFSEGFHE